MIFDNVPKRASYGAVSLEDTKEDVIVVDGMENGHSKVINSLENRRSSLERVQEFKAKRLGSTRIEGMKDKRLASFYRRQNEIIDFVCNTTEGVDPAADEEDLAEAHQRSVDLALTMSFYANVVLTIIKAVALGMSGSLAVLASLMDSVLDIVSGGILYAIERAKAMPDDKYNYPVGKNRLEPVGVLVFAMIMGTAAFQVVIESVTELISGIRGDKPEVSFGLAVQILTAVVIATKLFLWRFCQSVLDRTGSSAVEAYAQDHFNDVFTNAVGVAGLALGALLPKLWWADALAALCLAGYIISNWGTTALEEAGTIVGKAASPHLMQQLTYTVVAHDPRIKFVDTVRAFHFGHMFLVEVDIVLPPEMPLREAHDIGESLQFKLEGLEVVERAYVHLDFEYSHKPEH